MKIARIVFMVIACMAQTACVTPQESIPPETRAELIRLGRVIIDENETEEIRCKARIRYCDVVRESIEKHGQKSVDRQMVIDSFFVDGRKPKDLYVDDGRLHYMFERQNGIYATLTIYFGGWTGSYVRTAFPNDGIP